ncbi:MAG: hypothetical protein QXF76_00685 [Candidatus Anstonellales archaeon]
MLRKTKSNISYQKGQNAIETLIYTVLILTFFAIIILIYARAISESSNYDTFLKAKAICTKIVSNINAVASSNNNASKYLELENEINKKNYSIRFFSNDNLVQISEYIQLTNTGKQKADNPQILTSCYLNTRNVYSSYGSKTFTITKKKMLIKKADNMVIVYEQ